MLGELPTTLNVNGKSYRIRSDFRNILRIFEAFADEALSDQEKLYVCLQRMYADFSSIPKTDYQEAYEKASWFISCDQIEEQRHPVRVFNWVKDSPIMFPAINKVAGTEVRGLPYMHWWTFMGYFQSIDSDSLFGTVLSIRQKRAKGKKLEKYEKEFIRNNPGLMALDPGQTKPKTAEEKLQEIYNDLVKGGE